MEEVEIPAHRNGSLHFSKRQFFQALVFLGRVFVDLFRRALHCFERAIYRYMVLIHYFTATLGRRIHPHKRISYMRLSLFLLLFSSVAYTLSRIATMSINGLYTGSHRPFARPEDMDEVAIRSRILDEIDDDELPPEYWLQRAKPLLRDVGDGLQVDNTSIRCENTKLSPSLLADSNGHVCSHRQVISNQGCCNASDLTLPRVERFTCETCDTNAPHCCDDLEHCVSCCMHPLNMPLRRDFLTKADGSHPVYSLPGALTVFQYCQFRCRTSSASVQHQNSYRSHRSHCYGIHRPLKVLPTVNSDGLHEEWQERPGSVQGTKDDIVPSSWLEYDPWYQHR